MTEATGKTMDEIAVGAVMGESGMNPVGAKARQTGSDAARGFEDDPPIQWHPAFCDAMELTLLADADVLTFEREYNLGSKPLQVDLLVVRKNTERELSSAIGKMLRRHNLFEYKSPGDDLTIDDFYKVMAYGCLYKALNSKHVNEVPASEMTLTIVREDFPKAMFRDLAEEGTTAISVSPGIYRVKGNIRFATHVVVSRELPQESYVWLKALTRRISVEEAKRLVYDATSISTGRKERREAEAILRVALNANMKTFDELKKGDASMTKAYEILFKDEIEESDLKNIRNLMDSMHWSADLAMAALKIDPTKRERYAKLIEQAESEDKSVSA